MGKNTSKNAADTESKENKESAASSKDLSQSNQSTPATSLVPKSGPKPVLRGMNEALYKSFEGLLPNFIGYHRILLDIFNLIRPYLSISEIVRADTVRKLSQEKLLLGKKSFFKEKPDKEEKLVYEAKLALPLLQAVISGNLGANLHEENDDSLMNLVRKNPAALFMKGDVSFPNGCDVLVLPKLYKDLSQFKGHYIWVNQKQLIYVHYDGRREDVTLDNPQEFNQAIHALPKEKLVKSHVVPLTKAV